MTELADFITAEVQRQASEPTIRKVVEEKIGEVITRAIVGALSFGDLQKQITKAVENSLKVDGDLGLPAYGETVLNVLRRQMAATVDDLVAKRIEAEMADILKIGPKELKLSTLVETMEKEILEWNEGRFGSDLTCIVEQSEVSGYNHVYLDEGGGVRKYDCDVQIGVDEKGRIYSLSINHRDTKKTTVMGPQHGWRRMIFGIYGTGGKFIVDEGAVSRSIGDL